MRFCFLNRIFLILVSVSFAWVDLSAESIRSLEERIADIEAQLSELPIRVPGETGGSSGLFISHYRKDFSNPDTITIDLNQVYSIDQIALVPTRLQNLERQIKDVGFPIRFEIIGSEMSNFSNAIVFYDGADSVYPDPKGYPVIFEGNGKKARYLRIIVYDMPLVRGMYAFSLAELFVFSEGRNVALKKKVTAPSSTTWDKLFNDSFLVDGQTSLGQPSLPVKGKRRPRGWHARVQKKPLSHEFVELYFDRPQNVEEVRLYPVYHNFWPRGTDYGFPIHFRVQVREPGADWLNPKRSQRLDSRWINCTILFYFIKRFCIIWNGIVGRVMSILFYLYLGKKYI